MNKITRMSVGLMLSVITLFGLFAVAPQASAMTCNSATLTGYVITNGNPTHARFTYATSASVVSSGQGTPTVVQTFTSDGNMSQLVTGLTESTTYYFRSEVTNQYGTDYGNVNSFTTPACANNNPPPQVCQDTTATNYGGSLPCTYPQSTPAPTVTFYANPTTIVQGDFSSLTWSSTNTSNGGYCDFGVQGQATSRYGGMGSISKNPSQTTTYQVTCFNSAGQSASKTATVNVTTPTVNAPNVTISADQTNLAYNGSTIIRWNTTPTNVSCTATGGTNGWSGIRNSAGTFSTGALTSSVTFGMTCSNSGGQDSASVHITVAPQQQATCQNPSAINFGGPLPCQFPQQQVCQDPTATNFGGALPCRYAPQTCQNPSAINFGGPLPCQFPQQQICQDTTATNYGGALPCRYPTPTCQNPAATNFGGPLPCQFPVQTCQDPSAINFGGSLPCRYPTQICQNPSAINFGGPLPCQFPQQQVCQDPSATNFGGTLPCRYQNLQPRVTISADNTFLNIDDTTIIRWSSTNATSCTASGGSNGWSGLRNTSGTFYTGSLSFATTYNITCRNNSGDTDFGSVTVNVDNNNNNNRNISVRINADNTNLRAGDSTRINWNSTNANFCTARGGTNGWSGRNISTDGTFNTGALFSTTTFTIDCNNNNNSDSDSVTIYVNQNNQPGNDTAASPTASTLTATQITNSSAQLNSLIFSGGTNTDAWFQWGTTAAISNSTQLMSVGSATSISHSDILTGLVAGQTYFYRAVAQNPFGISYGSTLAFVTTSFQTITPPTTIVQNTTVINGGGTGSLVTLTIDGGADSITPSERRIYHVTWKNISSQTLNKVVLRILLPGTMVFDATNKGTFTLSDNSINLDLNTLSPAETGDMIFTAVAGTNLHEGELVVVVANMVYTNAAGVQGDAVAYATHHATLLGSVLGANAFGAGFLPTSFLGWLFLLILLLIIILLVRHLYEQNRSPKQSVIER